MKDSVFVDYVFKKKSEETSFRALMKHADNDGLAWMAWPAIQPFLKERINDRQLRSIYGMVASAIARSRRMCDGKSSFGKSMFQIARDQSSYSIRFRRMISADSVEELMEILRPVLRNMESSGVDVSYAMLLSDLYWFRTEGGMERVKSRWAEDYLRCIRESGYVSVEMDIE